MKRIYVYLLTYLLFFLCFVQVVLAFQDTTVTPTQPSPDITGFFEKDFWIKVTIAVVAAVLSFIGSYILAQKKQRSEPRKQLSYDKTIKKEIVEIQRDVREKVQVLYNGKIIKDLCHVACTIENTGNTVIKSQYIRFEFPDEAEILESFFEPLPEREMGVQEEQKDNSVLHEKRYLIKHIERTQQVGFRFVLTCPTNIFVEIHPYNEEGDVDFTPRTISMASDEKNIVEKFVVLYLMFYLIPPILYIIPFSELEDIGVGLIRLGIFLAMLPTIKPVAKIIATLIAKVSMVKNTESRITIGRAEVVEISNSSQKSQNDSVVS